MRFKTEKTHIHGHPNAGFRCAGTAILLCNLGTPDAPTAPALRRYLAEFLSDHRVVEIPKPLWWLILHGIILRVRPAKSARKYASIWMHGPDESSTGSPLKVWSARVAQALQDQLHANGHRVRVCLAMRYGQPSIASQLDALKADGITRVLVLPMYPQYSGTTTASVIDAVHHWSTRVRRLPELRFVNHYHDDAGYIEALAHCVQAHWTTHGALSPNDRLVLSFHGVPERTLHLGDPYHCECYKTARLLAERLRLRAEQIQVTFQSRFGKAKWLEPYTEPTLVKMAQTGVQRVDVLCPGFAVDCLETLEEIHLEAREAFLHAGGSTQAETHGRTFHYIACLNDAPAWIQALTHIAEQHLSGWDTLSAPDQASLQAQIERARALGANV